MNEPYGLTCDLELCEPVYVAIYGFPQCPLGHDPLRPNDPSYPKNTHIKKETMMKKKKISKGLIDKKLDDK